MKCPICNLTLADPPNGEEECRVGPAMNPTKRPEAISPSCYGLQNVTVSPTQETNTTPPYRAEVIDNAVLAMVGGVKL